MGDDPRWSARELREELDRYESELRAAGKTRNTVNTYVQHPERFINWLEHRYRPTRTTPSPRPHTGESNDNGEFDARQARGRSPRYEPLKIYLGGQSDRNVSLSFSQIEEILGAPLPPSAWQYPAWWANGQSGNHVHARSWLDDGWRTANVDLKGATVDFVR